MSKNVKSLSFVARMRNKVVRAARRAAAAVRAAARRVVAAVKAAARLVRKAVKATSANVKAFGRKVVKVTVTAVKAIGRKVQSAAMTVSTQVATTARRTGKFIQASGQSVVHKVSHAVATARASKYTAATVRWAEGTVPWAMASVAVGTLIVAPGAAVVGVAIGAAIWAGSALLSRTSATARQALRSFRSGLYTTVVALSAGITIAVSVLSPAFAAVQGVSLGAHLVEAKMQRAPLWSGRRSESFKEANASITAMESCEACTIYGEVDQASGLCLDCLKLAVQDSLYTGQPLPARQAAAV